MVPDDPRLTPGLLRTGLRVHAMRGQSARALTKFRGCAGMPESVLELGEALPRLRPRGSDLRGAHHVATCRFGPPHVPRKLRRVHEYRERVGIRFQTVFENFHGICCVTSLAAQQAEM